MTGGLAWGDLLALGVGALVFLALLLLMVGRDTDRDA